MSNGSASTPTQEIPNNPFRPGAGQRPVYLAGRTKEQDQFKRMLEQSPVMQNTILTGLRGKTVLLEVLKPLGQAHHWIWTGNDLSESASLTEERVAQRLVVDLSTLLRRWLCSLSKRCRSASRRVLNTTIAP